MSMARRLLPLLVAGAAAASASYAPAAVSSSVASPAQTHASGRTTARTFTLPAGKVERRFSMREGAGVILLSRITVPHGVRAHLDAEIPHLAGTGVSTGTSRPDPALTCRRSGGYDVCTQAQEWCPMPAATWQMRLVKTSGPAGPIRIDFVVGPPPAGG